MTIPKISDDIFVGLTASMTKKEGHEAIFNRTWQEITQDKNLYALFHALAQDCEKKSLHPEECQIGLVLGMVYTYMVLKAQFEADELNKQWSL